MDAVTDSRVHEDVLSVTVAETQDVTDHAHNRRSAAIRQACIVPVNHQHFNQAFLTCQ